MSPNGIVLPDDEANMALELTAGAPAVPLTRRKFTQLPALPALAMLMNLLTWVAWKYVAKLGEAKPRKLPIDPATGRPASISNPSTWGTYDEAAARAQRDDLPGVGFVLTADDGLTGIDLDDCYDPRTGGFSPLATEVLALAETFAEFSPSGRGLRLFARGKVDRTLKDDTAGIEVYGTKRYLTVTGNHVPGTPAEIRPAPKTLALLGYEGLSRTGAKPAHGGKTSNSVAASGFDRRGELPHPRIVADNCPAYDHLVDTRVTHREPLWRLMLGITLYTAGGVGLAHKLSKDHSRYSREETQGKIEKLKESGVGPFTCGFIEESLGEAAPCAGCRHYGNSTTSPIAIARREANRVALAGDGSEAQRLTIIIEAGEIASTVDKAEDALIAAGARLYQRAGVLVTPVRDEVRGGDGKIATVVRFKPITVHALKDILNRAADFQRWSKTSNNYVRCNPPHEVAEILLSREGEWKFPRVTGCVTTPTLRPDGTLLATPGYDSVTGLYYLPDPALTMPTIPEKPTRADAKRALAFLEGLLGEFPFAKPIDRAVAVSALMTPVLRGGMSASPMHLVRAHTSGTGKSFLVDIATTIANGQPWPASSVGNSPEELEKRLGALLLDGSPIVNLDNVNGKIGGDMLCQVTERPVVQIRVLGLSKMPRVECRATVLCNGNNTTVEGDLVRRTVTCNLDAGLEIPEHRQFEFDPMARVLANRGDYIAAILTIAMAYRAAGSPRNCPPLGSYADWTQAVRAPLVWLGLSDPVSSMEAARAEDPARASIRELVYHWEEAESLKLNVFYKASQIEAASYARTDELQANTDFREFLLRQCGSGGMVSTKALGNFLTRIHGQVFDGRKISMRPDKKHGNVYALVQVSAG